MWKLVTNTNFLKGKKGILIKSTTMTWSQKHFDFGDSNCTVYGFLENDNVNNIYDINANIIKKLYSSENIEDEIFEDKNINKLVFDVGSSGYSSVYIFEGNEKEQIKEIEKIKSY